MAGRTDTQCHDSIENKLKPQDAVAEMEMEAKVLNIKLTSRQNPEEIGESILVVEVKYNKSLPEAKRAAVVIRLGNKHYVTVITVTQPIV